MRRQSQGQQKNGSPQAGSGSVNQIVTADCGSLLQAFSPQKTDSTCFMAFRNITTVTRSDVF
jgi:hypothetical protein